MSSYAIQVAGEEHGRGPYLSRDEVRVALEALRAERRNLRGVSVWEMSEGGSAGAQRELSDFVDIDED